MSVGRKEDSTKDSSSPELLVTSFRSIGIDVESGAAPSVLFVVAFTELVGLFVDEFAGCPELFGE